jgi:hypothetical protein
MRNVEDKCRGENNKTYILCSITFSPEGKGRRGIRRRKLLDDLKERSGYSHLKEAALDCTIWRVRFGRGFAPVVRQDY